MSAEFLSLLFFGSLLLFLMLGAPLAFVLGGISVIFLYVEMGSVGFYIVASRMWETMDSFILLAAPLYIFMAMILERSGVASDLYRMMHVWFGGLRGGLAIGTVVICAIFAAMSGISGAAVVTMGTIALPRMLERGYDRRLALGAINAGGGWGILIPPSILMVLYAMMADVSVGRLFAAGIGPGLLMLLLVSLYIGLRCAVQPELGPVLPLAERSSWSIRMRSLGSVFLPLLIVTFVLGSIFGGFATPTEAAAIGVLGALAASRIKGTLSLSAVQQSALGTLRLTTMIMWILLSAYAFSTAYSAMGAQSLIADVTANLPGGRWGALACMMLVLFVLGTVLDPVGIMLITLPVFLPIVQLHGFDPIWFGILFVIMMEIGYMTPPFGFNLFYLKGVVPDDITMNDLYASVWPYVFVTLLGLLIIILFPPVATYLPGYFFDK